MINYNELTLQELKKLAKDKGVEIDRKDTKAILIEKIKEHNTKDIKRVTRLENVRKKMSKTKKVIVTKLNPEDTIRDSILVTITNVTGSYTCAVPFNVEVNIPEPIIANLKEMKYQGWEKRTISGVGQTDVPVILPAYNVQELS